MQLCSSVAAAATAPVKQPEPRNLAIALLRGRSREYDASAYQLPELEHTSTYYLLLATYFLLPTTYYLLFTIYYLLLSTYQLP